MERLNEIIVIVGRKGCGKTTFAKKIIKASRKKVLIVDLLDHPGYREFPQITTEQLPTWVAGNYRIFRGDINNTLVRVNKDVWNALIIFEDCSRYIEPNVGKSIKSLFAESKQHNQDLILMFHALTEIPPYVARMMDKLVMFRTDEVIDKPNGKFYNWETIRTAQHRVRKSKNKYYCEIIEK